MAFPLRLQSMALADYILGLLGSALTPGPQKTPDRFHPLARNENKHALGATMVKLVVRDRESIQEAVRRFRKLVERSGIKKEMRRREYYEKPSETKRRSRLRAERRGRRSRLLSV